MADSSTGDSSAGDNNTVSNISGSSTTATSTAPLSTATPSTTPSTNQVQIDPQALDLQNADEFQIMVEFSEPSMPQPGHVGTRGGSARNATSQIEQRSQGAIRAAMSTIREMALQTDAMRQGIPGGSQPRMVKVKFGINLDFEVGAFLAKSGVGATMEVELEWARRSDDVLRVLKADTDVDGALFTDAE